MDYCSAVELKFRARHRLRHSRKPIAARFLHQAATHTIYVSDFVTTVTQRVTVAWSNYNFEHAIVSAIAENPSSPSYVGQSWEFCRPLSVSAAVLL